MLMNMEPIRPELVLVEMAKVAAENELRAREQLAAQNRAAGIPAPKVGDKMYVSCGRGVLRRSRGHVAFSPASPKREVTVVDANAVELAKRHSAGEPVVDLHGAEEILADGCLIVHRTNTPDVPSDREERLAVEVDQLKAELAAARRAAGPDPGDGSSARMKAAQKTRDEFGK